MKTSKRTRNILAVLLLAVVLVAALCSCAPAETGTDYGSPMVGTFWSLVPPIVAIVLALITKEVHSSLFVGIVVGALFYTNFGLTATMDVILNEGFIAALADAGNVGIIIFLVLLGTMVALINRAGGTAAYGDWAKRTIKTRKGAILATFGLGCLIFVDDYFNCLTVGSVMRPVTDNHQISRAKLAYIIDATASPVCMIAPISSWAAAVSGYVDGYNGLALFIRAIPYNFYSLMTIVMMLVLTIGAFDFGPMKTHERNATENNDLFTTESRPYTEEEKGNANGKVADLVFPIVVLIVCCICGMIYTGGFFDGVGFIDAFADCDSSVGLSLGSAIAVIITIIFLLVRRTVSFQEAMSCFPAGFQAMVPAILILTFAWSLSNITSLMGAGEYVAGIMENTAGGFAIFLPAIIFAVAAFLGFSTGTAWGTFGILIPIVVALFPATGDGSLPTMLIISISACCAGGVCGDHCSPISDTTIMASTGAQCDHINHVSTQLPYAITCIVLSFVGYIIAGITQSAWIALPATLIITIVALLVIRTIIKKKA